MNVMGRGWLSTLLTVLSGGGGLVADWLVKNKGIGWRLERIRKTKQVETEHGDGETKTKS